MLEMHTKWFSGLLELANKYSYGTSRYQSMAPEPNQLTREMENVYGSCPDSLGKNVRSLLINSCLEILAYVNKIIILCFICSRNICIQIIFSLLNMMKSLIHFFTVDEIGNPEFKIIIEKLTNATLFYLVQIKLNYLNDRISELQQVRDNN